MSNIDPSIRCVRCGGIHIGGCPRNFTAPVLTEEQDYANRAFLNNRRGKQVKDDSVPEDNGICPVCEGHGSLFRHSGAEQLCPICCMPETTAERRQRLAPRR